MLKKAPKIGAIVETPKGIGTVVEQNLLIGSLRIRLDSLTQAVPVTFNLNDVKIIKDAKICVDEKEINKFKNLE